MREAGAREPEREKETEKEPETERVRDAEAEPETGTGNKPETGSGELSRRDVLWLGLAVAFTLLGVVIQLIPGMKFTGQFCFFITVGCIAWLLLGKWAERSRRGRLCQRIFAGLLGAGVLFFCLLETLIITRGSEDWSALPTEAVIVLGAGVNGTTPSLSLQTRIDTAAAYLEAHPDIPAVLSGGQGPGEDIPEAEAMYTALTALGIDGSRLYMEDQSTSTAENFAYSMEVLDAIGVDPETADIAVITNDFHMFRARMLAQRQGLQMIAVPASLPYGWLTANYYFREAFALVKSAVFD